MTSTTDIVAKLWRLCDILRDDGITYHEYVTELTYLLFLKMLAETGREDRLPDDYRWGELVKREGNEQLVFYRRLLLDLGVKGRGTIQAIFVDAQTRLRKPTNLKAIVEAIDGLDWFSAREEGLGNLYEGLLEKNAAEKKSGAGQYFTPRPLIDSIIRLLKPQPGEVVQDPAREPAASWSRRTTISRPPPTTSTSSQSRSGSSSATTHSSAWSWCRIPTASA
jgi:type I restriction enzyme M protein